MINGNRNHPALKHGAYSGATLLPGEDPSAFEKLHKDLISEFNPGGCLEEDIVLTMARLVWRKQNLLTYRMAEEAKNCLSALQSEFSPQVARMGQQRAGEQARKELGQTWELVELRDVVTVDYLLNEIAVVDRLDGAIDRCLKRLLLVRGLKSISASSSTTPASRRTEGSAAA